MNGEGGGEQSRFAWQEIARDDGGQRSAVERVSDYLEVYSHLDEDGAREQARRCVQCPDPSCVEGCPMASRIPEWLALTAEGHFREAAEVLVVSNVMPDVFSKVCEQDRQCEARCVLEGRSDAVAIGAVERFLQEYALNHGLLNVVPRVPNGFRVAVIGSGAGGLVCAEDLTRLGTAVTLFDAQSVPGGLLIQGMPSFRLARSVVERRVEILRRRGVVFRTGVQLHHDITLDQLRYEFDAVYLAIGARRARRLEIPGADLKGVIEAVPFIVDERVGESRKRARLGVKGKRVVVIGGGDSAVDSLRMALRRGASSATAVYRRDLASLPATRQHVTNAVEEGARYEFAAMPVSLRGNERGRVTHVRCVRTLCDGEDPDGRSRFIPDPVNAFELRADIVVVAIGFEREEYDPGDVGARMARDAEGNVVVDENQMTNLSGVFVGGDLVHGPGRLVDAVREARNAARSIQLYLSRREPKGKRG